MVKIQSGRAQVTEFFKTKMAKVSLKHFFKSGSSEAALHFNSHPNLTLYLLCRSEDAISVRAAMQALPLKVTTWVCVLRTLNSIIYSAVSMHRHVMS